MYSQLETADYKNLDVDRYETLTGVLEEAARQIHRLTDLYYSMQKVVNGIYAQCLPEEIHIVSRKTFPRPASRSGNAWLKATSLKERAPVSSSEGH
ncbi:MAG: hypothetical protein ACLSG9_10590 [Eubacterium sp.]